MTDQVRYALPRDPRNTGHSILGGRVYWGRSYDWRELGVRPLSIDRWSFAELHFGSFYVGVCR